MADRGKVKLLIDNNIFLEVILGQEKAEEAKALLTNTKDNDFFFSDYSVHSIGLLLFRRKQHDIFQEFLLDLTTKAGMRELSIRVDELRSVIKVAQKFNLDFDDAYQYAIAEKRGLTLVSFDKDFDHTDRGKKTPAEILSL